MALGLNTILEIGLGSCIVLFLIKQWHTNFFSMQTLQNFLRLLNQNLLFEKNYVGHSHLLKKGLQATDYSKMTLLCSQKMQRDEEEEKQNLSKKCKFTQCSQGSHQISNIPLGGGAWYSNNNNISKDKRISFGD